MNNNRDKFEAWAKAHEIDITINPAPSYDARLYNDDETDAMYCGWQAATEQSQKEIAEKDAMIAEYDRLMSIDDTRIVLLQHNIVELQAREKVLVEAISSSLNCIREEINLNNYTETVLGDFISGYGDMVIILQYALATVRGE